MLVKLIAFLQWIQSSEKLKNRVDFLFSMLFLFVTAIGAYNFLQEILFQRNYGYYYDSYRDTTSWLFINQITENTFIFSITIFLLLSLIMIYVYGFYKRIVNREFSVVGLIVNSALPIFVGIILVVLYATEQNYIKWYIFVIGWIYAFSPYLLFLAGFPKINVGKSKFILDMYKKYIIAFLIGFAVFVVLFFLGNFQFHYMRFSHIVTYLSLIIIPYSIIIWLILTYAWTTLEKMDERSWRNILRSWIVIAFLFLVIWLSPNWKTLVIDDRIDRAQTILGNEGNTKEWIKGASKVWFLKWALQAKFLEGNLYPNEKQLYTRLYDTSIESDIDSTLDADKYKARNSNATSMLARWENAKVELNFAKHESEILSDINAVKTTITYEFQNTTTSNQEVVFNVMLPNTESVMSDLHLGLNLEYTGTIAPRGAAAKVYQDSLRRNTDPALLEQTGPISYRLRVFPVTSTSDSKTQWRQRVQFTYISPLSTDGILTIVPKTDVINLKLTEKSEIFTRVIEGSKVISQDSQSGDDIQILTEWQKNALPSSIGGKSYNTYCSVNDYPNIDITPFKTSEKKLTKNIVFFDISKSVGEKSGIKKRYQSLINAWKNNWVSLDIFTYNFDIYSHGYTLDNIDFWWTTDMSKIIDYIDRNNISNTNIVIITDDNSFEQANEEIKSIDYKKLKSNKISIIQVGEKIRTLKTEITKAVLATDGSMMVMNEKWDLSEAVKNIFVEQKTPEQCENYNWSSMSFLGVLQGYEDGRMVIGNTLSFTWNIRKEKDFYKEYKYNQHSFDSLSSYGEWEPLISALIEDSILKWEEYEIQNIYFDARWSIILPSWYTDWWLLTFDHSSNTVIFQIYQNSKVIKDVRKQLTSKDIEDLWEKAFFEDSEEMITKTDNDLLETIAKTTHIVTQATSLIALESDNQRADLERYSQQEDKYDTTYQNFTNESSRDFDRGSFSTMNIEDGFSPAVEANLMWSSENLFWEESSIEWSSLSAQTSTDSYNLDMGSNSNGRFIKYIIASLFFPLIAWFILRRKQKGKETAKEETV